MEFYRAAASLLSSNHMISPDVGYVFGSNGYLDFYVNGSKLQWGIELLREGQKEKEHSDNRFKKGGAYAILMNHMKRSAAEHVSKSKTNNCVCVMSQNSLNFPFCCCQVCYSGLLQQWASNKD